jgi:hypothetical protein
MGLPPTGGIVARVMLPRACGCLQEFQHYKVDKYLAERQAKFQSTRCPACVAKFVEEERKALPPRKADVLKQLPPGTVVTLRRAADGSWGGNPHRRRYVGRGGRCGPGVGAGDASGHGRTRPAVGRVPGAGQAARLTAGPHSGPVPHPARRSDDGAFALMCANACASDDSFRTPHQSHGVDLSGVAAAVGRRPGGGVRHRPG